MRVFGITGWKDSGKTTLVERLVAELTRRGLAVATVKHAHHGFDVDQPGRDSHRHRMAGASQVLVSSPRRWALMTENRGAPEPALADLLARLDPVDLVLVEGFKRDRHPKLECRRAVTARPPIAAEDETVEAIATDVRLDPPLEPERVAVFDLDDASAIADFILRRTGLAPQADRPEGRAETALAPAPTPPPLRDDCFALPPGIEWVPVDEALARLRAALAPVAAAETVPLEAALGRLLAEPTLAARAHPPAANSAVDGYGFAHATLGEAPHLLPLARGRAAAGQPHGAPVPPGQALRVLTGAILPEGVDTVALDEDCLVEGGAVHLSRAPKRGANTRAAGEDVAPGDRLLAPGRLVTPGDLALAAAAGLGMLRVRRPLRVALLSTGDELRRPGERAEPHQTYDANRPMLAAILRRWGMEPVDLGLAPDRAEAVAAALDRGAAEADAILTSGGASAGDEDHVARTLRERGALETWRVAVKPGRPLALGVWNGTPVFGLPGNPVAAFVCALVFARPALLALAGAPWTEPRGLLLPAAFAKSKKAGRREYLRARLDAEGAVEVFRSEGSGRVSGLSWAEGLVELPDPAGTIAPGDPVRYLSFSAFGL